MYLLIPQVKQLKKTMCQNYDKQCASVEVDERYKITSGWVLTSTLIKTETITPCSFLQFLNKNERVKDSVKIRTYVWDPI